MNRGQFRSNGFTSGTIALLTLLLGLPLAQAEPSHEGWLYQIPASNASLANLDWNDQLLNPFSVTEETGADSLQSLYCEDSTSRHADSQPCKGLRWKPRISAMLAHAKKFIGTPYRYGGTTPDRGFDCSGFVLYNLKRIGVTVPRTARAQFQRTIPVAETDLKAGDLVFFRTRGRSQRISHVGIFLGDGKRFIHAASRKSDIMISSLDDTYWRPRFVRGGRLKLG